MGKPSTSSSEEFPLNSPLAPGRLPLSSTGRWLSPDPLGGDISNPQSLNRYAYVLNNPTNLIDPLGLSCDNPLDGQPCIVNVIGHIGGVDGGGGGGDASSSDLQKVGGGKGGGGGVSGGKAPLSPSDQTRYSNLKAKAIGDIMNPDCLSFLCSHGIDPTMFQLTLAFQQAFNGSRSMVTQGAAQTGITFPTQTVAQGFNARTGVQAAASLNGTDVYFRHGGFFGNVNIQEAIIEHEALHNLTGLGDEALQGKLGVPQTPYDTTDINQALKDHHCTH